MSNEKKITVRQFIQRNKNKFSDRKTFREACQKITKCHPRRFDSILGEEGLLDKFPANDVKKSTLKRRIKHKGIGGFAQLYDKSKIIPEKIQRGIDTVLFENHWMYDVDFRLSCDVSSADWRRYAEQFDHLQLKVEGKLVWGHPDYIDEMRRIINR